MVLSLTQEATAELNTQDSSDRVISPSQKLLHTQKTQKKTNILSAGFKTETTANERPHTYALEGTATWIGGYLDM